MENFGEVLRWMQWIFWTGTAVYAAYLVPHALRRWKQLRLLTAECEAFKRFELQHPEPTLEELEGLRQWVDMDIQLAKARRRQKYKANLLALLPLSHKRSASDTKIAMLSRPPGWRLHGLASFVYSRKTFDRVFAQTLRDMQDEHIEALHEGDLRKARWVILRGHWSFWSAAAAQLPVSIAKKLYDIWKIGR